MQMFEELIENRIKHLNIQMSTRGRHSLSQTQMSLKYSDMTEKAQVWPPWMVINTPVSFLLLQATCMEIICHLYYCAVCLFLECEMPVVVVCLLLKPFLDPTADMTTIHTWTLQPFLNIHNQQSWEDNVGQDRILVQTSFCKVSIFLTNIMFEFW